MQKLTRLKEIRVKAGYTQEELAAKSGVTGRTISNIENCRVKPTLNNAKAIAKALKIKLEDLI